MIKDLVFGLLSGIGIGVATLICCITIHLSSISEEPNAPRLPDIPILRGPYFDSDHLVPRRNGGRHDRILDPDVVVGVA
jgi:hypothetical protein